jgi:hypothetical protein
VILEPIPANAGLYLPRNGFLEQLRAECTREGALLIFDEVMTGFRVARGGAQELYQIRNPTSIKMTLLEFIIPTNDKMPTINTENATNGNI